MRTIQILIALGIILQTHRTFAQATVSVVARSKSIQLQPVSFSQAPYGVLTDYFTTPDGLSNFPLHDVIGPYYYFSGELRPRSGQSGVYETDFLVYSSIYGFLNYGTTTINLPTTDANGNGIPDFLEKQNACNVSFTGTSVYDYPAGLTASISGTLSRSAGQVLGSYSVYFPSAGLTINGTWWIGNAEGTATYIRGATNSLDFSLTRIDPLGVSDTVTGKTTFSVVSTNQLTLAPFSIAASRGDIFHIGGNTTLQRSGARFVGPLTLDDGLIPTSWQDFRNWTIEISDANDTNLNGIPNISDSPTRPAILISKGLTDLSLNLSHQANQRYVIEYSSDLKVWSTLTTILPTSSSSLVSDAQPRFRRFYRVRTE